MTDISHSLDANRWLLDQAADLLERLTDDQYALPRGEWAPVGAQYRHVLEHYQCLLAGLPTATIDYDSRRRDATLETSRREARAATGLVRDSLADLASIGASRPVKVQLRTTTAATAPEWSESTIARELQFLVSHTVHHYALIKLLLATDGVTLHPDFGMAPSTLAHARIER